jgi:membrane protease YdiL (CAAX protease family)
MREQGGPTVGFAGIAGLFEGGLAVVAIVVGYLVGHSPMATIEWTAAAGPANLLALLWGGLAALPMLAGLVLAEHLPLAPLIRLRRVVRLLVVPLFRDATVIELALISLIAGIGEELLFRGLMQDALAAWIGGTAGLCIAVAASSFVFGLAHALTRTYAVLATGVGIYLGLLFLFTGNLLAPIAAHAVYDFVALLYLLRQASAGT